MWRVRPHITTNKMLANHNSATLAMQFWLSFTRDLARLFLVCTTYWILLLNARESNSTTFAFQMELSHVRILCSKFVNLST
jgi:hypothetical protein